MLLGTLQAAYAAGSWFAGGDYSYSNVTGSWVNSNVPPTLSGPSLITFVWQGAYTNTNWFVQEVLRMVNPTGWRVEFWSFDSNGTVKDEVITNTYEPAGCNVQYGQYYQATNSIFSFILGIQSSGCSSFSQTWIFNDGSYGNYFIPVYALLESYDYTCSDFTGFGSAQFTSAIDQIGSTYGTPTFQIYRYQTPSCWSVSAGTGSVTVTFTG